MCWMELKLVECNARKVGLSALLVGNGLKLRHSASTFRWCLSALLVGNGLKPSRHLSHKVASLSALCVGNGLKRDVGQFDLV